MTITQPTFTPSAVDGFTTIELCAGPGGRGALGLLTTPGHHPITLVANSPAQISGQYDSDGTPRSSDGVHGDAVWHDGDADVVGALEHSNTPQGVGEDNTLDLDDLINVVSTVTMTDGDNDVVSTQSASSGLSLTFDDTDPTLSIRPHRRLAPPRWWRRAGLAGRATATITPPTFTASAVDGFTTDVSYALALAGAAATGLLTDGGQPSDHAGGRLGHRRSPASTTATASPDLDATAFTVTLSGTTVTLTSLVALGALEQAVKDLCRRRQHARPRRLINVVSSVR